MLTTLIPVLGEVITKIVDRIPDPAARQKAEEEMKAVLLNAAIEEMRGQSAVNLEEAKHSSVWVSGWRPAIGWSCALAFCFMYVIAPIAQWVGLTSTLPAFDANALMSLTTGMLGIAGFRTFEKIRGVTK